MKQLYTLNPKKTSIENGEEKNPHKLKIPLTKHGKIEKY